MFRQLAHDGRLESRMHGAITTERVLARFPVLPIGSVPELVPRLGVRLADEVTRAFPAFWREGDRAPRRAFVFAQAGGELEEHRRRRQAVTLGDLQHTAELAMDLVAREEDVALHRLVVIAGRDEHSLDAHRSQ